MGSMSEGHQCCMLTLIVMLQLFNRIKMQRAFEPITWYPRYLQYILIFISTALPLGVAGYIMYLVVLPVATASDPTWPVSREYALLVAAVWCIGLDNCVCIPFRFLRKPDKV